MSELEVTCAHCGAENTINVPDDHAGQLKWECRPCGGVCAIRLGPEPEVDEQVVGEADVQVFDVDGGGGHDAVR